MGEPPALERVEDEFHALDILFEELAKSNAEINRLQTNQIALVDVLRAYEQWENDLIECNEAWQNSLPQFTQKLYDSWMKIQARRNAALDSLEDQSNG